MDASPLPLGWGQGFQERQPLGPAPLTRGQRLMSVVPEILPFLRPSRGIERMDNRAADSPGSQVGRACPQYEDAGLVERDHGVEPDLEELLDITKVADDFLGRPAVGVWALG